ncbi:hypothetical protein ACFXJ8_41895 [Nonomuraea sp. NPDC059194]
MRDIAVIDNRAAGRTGSAGCPCTKSIEQGRDHLVAVHQSTRKAP